MTDSIKVSTSPDCIIECSFSLFNKYTGAMWCKKVQNMTRAARRRACGCDCCQQKKPLDAAHKRHLSRLDIIKQILEDNYKIGPDLYRVDLIEFERKFVAAHKPFDETFYFLCHDCHEKYDNNDPAESDEVVAAIFTNKKGV